MSNFDDDMCTLVLDFGSQTMRAGFAGDDAPRAVLPTVKGKQKSSARMCMLLTMPDTVVGDQAQASRGIFSLESPVKNGIVHNWDAWEEVMRHTMQNELRIEPSEKNVTFPVALNSPLANEQKYAQCMFEEFGVQAILPFQAHAASLYASGRGVGIICDIGHGLTQIGAIYEGARLSETEYSSTLAGEALTEYMARMLSGVERLSIATKSPVYEQYSIADDLKKKCAYVPLDFDVEMQLMAESSAKEIELQYPGGQPLLLNTERIRCPEALFKPSLIGRESLSLPQMIYKSIMIAPMDVRKDLWGNVILSGGTSLCPGLAERLQAELTALAPPTIRVKTIAPPERLYSVWIGGSIIGSLSTAKTRFFTKEEYDEKGPVAIHQYGTLSDLNKLPRLW